ncbi:MAG: ATPase synthesis protein 25 mitochondrial [Alyxoria varia]|nr:MAG: ATPase synthesis protein 25 mitochondrial [Alyxoria varia]
MLAGKSALSSAIPRCNICQRRALHCFVATPDHASPSSSALLPERIPSRKAQRVVRVRGFSSTKPSRAIATPFKPQKQPIVTDLEAYAASISRDPSPEDLDEEEAPSTPWYLRHELDEPETNPFAAQQRLPELPPEPPPILENLLQHLSVDIGLDYLSILDLRGLDPPPALGSNLLMVVGTARSEKHLNVSADRLCRWLRSTHKITPFADGLLGRQELKLRFKRKNRRQKILSAAGAQDAFQRDDGTTTGWICVNLGSVTSGKENTTEKLPPESDGFVGFGEETDDVRIVVQMMTEEKRGDLGLETLWQGIIRRFHQTQDSEIDPQLPRGHFSRDYGDASNRRSNSRQKPSSNSAPGVRNFTTSTSSRAAAVTPVDVTSGDGISGAKHTQSVGHEQTRSELLQTLTRFDPAELGELLGLDENDKNATQWLRSFWGSMSPFPALSDWEHIIYMHCYALQNNLPGYSLSGLLRHLRSMEVSGTHIPEKAFKEVLRALLHSSQRLYQSSSQKQQYTPVVAMNVMLSRSFDVLEMMEAHGHAVCTTEIFLDLHRSLIDPEFLPETSLRSPDADTDHSPLPDQGEASTESSAPESTMDDPTSSKPTNAVQHRLSPAQAQILQHHYRQSLNLLFPRPQPTVITDTLLDTFSAQGYWSAFWSVWHQYPLSRQRRGEDLYALLFARVAEKEHVRMCRAVLAEWVPEMERERPEVKLEGVVALGVWSCLRAGGVGHGGKVDRRIMGEPVDVELHRSAGEDLDGEFGTLMRRVEKQLQDENDHDGGVSDQSEDLAADASAGSRRDSKASLTGSVGRP